LLSIFRADAAMAGVDIVLPVKKPSAYIESMATPDLMTADELLALNLQDKRTELVRGRLVVREPAGFRHGVVAAELTARLADFARMKALGVVVAAETGFKIFSNPDTVRAPDVGFIRAERVPHPLPRGYGNVAPDLAVEVLSPDYRAGEVLAKVSDWLSAGCRLVWVIDADRRMARVYRADGSESIISADSTLDGEDVLPGFTCRVEEVV
jgi:Uma2 family endonuclease